MWESRCVCPQSSVKAVAVAIPIPVPGAVPACVGWSITDCLLESPGWWQLVQRWNLLQNLSRTAQIANNSSDFWGWGYLTGAGPPPGPPWMQLHGAVLSLVGDAELCLWVGTHTLTLQEGAG